MTKFGKNIVLVSIILLFNLCSNSKETDLEYLTTFDVSQETIETTNSFTDLISEIKLIPIEYDSTIIFGRVNKARFYNDKYYLLDTWSTKSLTIVDDNGNLLKQISSIGRGPAEYIIPRDFFIDEFFQELVIIDDEQRKVLKYDLNGDFKEELLMGFRVFAGDILDRDHYAMKTFDKMPEIAIVNRNLEIVKRVHQWHRELDINLEEPFFKFEGQLFYHEYLNDTIYQVFKDKCIPRYYFDFGPKKISQNDIAQMVNGSNRTIFTSYMPEGSIGGIVKVSLSNNFKIIQYQEYRRLKRKVVFDDNKTVDIGYEDPFLKHVNIVGIDDSKRIIGLIEAFELCEIMKNDGNENVSKKSIISSISGINNLNEKIKDYHNPIIVKLSIKGLCLEPLI